MSRETANIDLWMPWYIRNHRGDASTLSHLEHSALVYFRMLLWEHGGHVPSDAKMIAKALKISVRKFSDMRSTLLFDCTVANGFISHLHTIESVARARTNIDQRRMAGRASAASRAEAKEVNDRSTAVATIVQQRAGRGRGRGPSQVVELREGVGVRDGFSEIGGER